MTGAKRDLDSSFHEGRTKEKSCLLTDSRNASEERKGVKRLSKASFISERRESDLISRRGQARRRKLDDGRRIRCTIMPLYGFRPKSRCTGSFISRSWYKWTRHWNHQTLWTFRTLRIIYITYILFNIILTRTDRISHRNHYSFQVTTD